MKLHKHNGLCNVSGARIRQRREELKLSQEQLSARLQLLGLELNQKVISRVETGLRVVPDFELEYYARALDADVLWLLGLD